MTTADATAPIEGPEPEEGDEPEEKLPFRSGWSLFRRFWPYLRGHRRLTLGIGLLLLLSLPCGVVPPFLVRDLIDSVMQGSGGEDSSATVAQLARQGAWIVGLSLCSQLLGYFQSLLSLSLHNRVRFRVTGDVFRRLLRLPLARLQGRSTGAWMARVRDDVKSLDSLMLDSLMEAAVQVLKALICLVLLLFLDPGLALAGLILVALISGAVLAVSPALRRRSAIERETDAASSASLHESLSGLVTVRIGAMEAVEQRRYLRSVKEWVRAVARQGVLGAMTGSAVGLIGVMGAYVIIVVAAYRIHVGLSTFGNLLAFFLILFQMMGAAGSVMALVPAMQKEFAALQRLFGLLDEEIEPRGRPRAQAPAELRGQLRFERVGLVYANGTRALQDVDLEVAAGEVIALIGRSGSGKTSLAQLLPRLYRPTEGRILLDGTPLDELPLRWLRERIGVVPQDVFLFDRSLRENIAHARPAATDDEIEAAARAAHAHDFIQALPRGYDTEVGERGVRLSGGEKQRIAIAREILRDPPVLVLDEATSNLDTESELAVRDAVERLMQSRTCFVIAHRLSTIRGADRIVVLQDGRIVESGPPAQLFSEDGAFRRMSELQLLDAPEPRPDRAPPPSS